MSQQLQRAYVLLVDAMRAPRKKSTLEDAVRQAMRAVRAALVEAGANPDAAWIDPGPVKPQFPSPLYVSVENERDGSWFFLAHEDGIGHLDNGERVGTYRLESTGIVKVTTELTPEGT